MSQRIGSFGLLGKMVRKVRRRELGEKVVSGTIDAGILGVTDSIRYEVSDRAKEKMRRRR